VPHERSRGSDPRLEPHRASTLGHDGAYLGRAGARLGAHPDRAAVLQGLERSIAAQLARDGALLGVACAEGTLLAALKRVGRVDGPELGEPSANASVATSERRSRRLFRLRHGQQLAGVCTGLAAFAEVDVNIVRLLFIVGTLFTGGLLIAAYVILVFVMPIARTEEEIAAAHGGMPPGARAAG
jgi:phage shock protein C